MRWPTRKGKPLAKGSKNEALAAGLEGQDDDRENSETNGNFAVQEIGDDERNDTEVEEAEDDLPVHDREEHEEQQVSAAVPSKETIEGGDLGDDGDSGDDRQHCDEDPDGDHFAEQRGGEVGDAIAPEGFSVHAKSKSAGSFLGSIRAPSLKKWKNLIHRKSSRNKKNDAGKGKDYHEGDVAADGDDFDNDRWTGDEDGDDDEIVSDEEDLKELEEKEESRGFTNRPQFAGSCWTSLFYWALFGLVLIICLAYLFWWAFVWIWPAFDCDGAVAPPTECSQGLEQIAMTSGQNRFLWLGECTDLSRLENLLKNADKITARTFVSQIFDPRIPDTLSSWDSWRDGSLYEVASCYDLGTRIFMFSAIGLGLIVFIALSWLGESLHEEKEAQLYRPILNVAMVFLTMRDFADLSADDFEKYFSSLSEIDAVERCRGENHWIMKFATKPYVFLKDTVFGLTYTTNAFKDLRNAHFGDDDASPGTPKVFPLGPATFVALKRDLEAIEKNLQRVNVDLQEATKQFADQSESLLSAIDKVTEGLDRDGDVDEDSLHDAQVPMDKLFEKMENLKDEQKKLKDEQKKLMERRRRIEQKLQKVTGEKQVQRAAYYAVEMVFFAFTIVNKRELYWRRPSRRPRGQPDASDTGSGPFLRLKRCIWFPRFSCRGVTNWFWRLLRCGSACSKCSARSRSPCCRALCACSRPKRCSFKGCVDRLLNKLDAPNEQKGEQNDAQNDGAEKEAKDVKEAYPLLRKYDSKELLSNYVHEVLTKWAVSAYIFWFSALSALAVCIWLVSLYVLGLTTMSKWTGMTRNENCTRLSDLLPSHISFAGRCIDYNTLYELLVEVEEADFAHGPFYTMRESVMLIDDTPDNSFTRAYAQIHLCAAHPYRKTWAAVKTIAIAVAMVSWFGYYIFSRRAVRWVFLPFIGEGYNMGVGCAWKTMRRLCKGLCWLGGAFWTCISGLWSVICTVVRHGSAVCRDQRALCSFKRSFPDEGDVNVDTNVGDDDGGNDGGDDDNDKDDDDDDKDDDDDDKDDDDGSQQGENASFSTTSMPHQPLPSAGSSGSSSIIVSLRNRLPRWPSSPLKKVKEANRHASINAMRSLAKRSRQGIALVILIVMLLCFLVVFCTVFTVSVTPFVLVSGVLAPSMVGLATSIMSGEFGLLLVILVVLAVVVPLVLLLRANWRCALSISPGRCRACAEKHHRYRFWESCQTHYCETHKFFKDDGNACPACESKELLCGCSGRNKKLLHDCGVCFCAKHQRSKTNDVSGRNKKLLQDCGVCFCAKHQRSKTNDASGHEGDPARKKLCLICTDPCPQHELVYRLDCGDCYCQREGHKGEPLRSDKRGCAKCFCQSNPDHRDVKLDVLTGLCPECTCAHHMDRSECEVCWCEIHDRATSVVCRDCNSTHLGSHKPECKNEELNMADLEADRICMNCSFGCNACRADGVRKEDVCWEEDCTLHWCSTHERFGRPDSNGKCECEVCVDPCPYCIKLDTDEKKLHARTECHGPPEGPRRGHYCVEHQREAPENDGRCIVCNGEPTCHHDHEGEGRILTRQECARHDGAHWCFAEMHQMTNEGLVEVDGGVDLVEVNGQCPVCADPCEECPTDRKRAKTMCASHYCAAHARYRVKGYLGFGRCAACEDPCPECKQKLLQQDIEDRGAGVTKAPKADECKDHYCSKHKRRVNLGRAETSERDDGRCLVCTDPCKCGHSVPAQECEKCYCVEHKRFLCASDRCADGYCDLCICSYCKRRRDKDEKPIHGRCIRCKGWCDHDVDLETCEQCFCSKHGQPRLVRKQPVLDGAKPEVLPCLRCISCEHEGEDFWSAGEEESMRGEHANEGYIGRCSQCYCRHQRDDHPPAYCDHLLTRACQSADSPWVRVCTRCSVVPLPLTKTRFCKFAAKLHNCLALTNKLPEILMREYWPARGKWGAFSPERDLGRLSWRDLEEHVSFRHATREQASVSIFSGGRQVNSSRRGDQCAFAVRVAIHALEEQFEVVNLGTGERAKLIQFEEEEKDTSSDNSRRSDDQGGSNGPGRDTNRWHPWFSAGSDDSPSLSTYRYGAVEAGSLFLEGRKLDDIFRADSLWDASSDRRWWPDGSNGDDKWKASDSWYAHDPMTDVLTKDDIKQLAAIAVDLKDSVEATRFPRSVTYFSEENQLGFLVQDPAQQAMSAPQSTTVELFTDEVRKAEQDLREYLVEISRNRKSEDADPKSYTLIREVNEQDAKAHADAERFLGMGLTPYVPPALRPLRRDTQLSSRGTFASGQRQLSSRAVQGRSLVLWKSERLRTTRSTSGSIGRPSEGRRRRTWAAVLRSISGRTLRGDGENSDDEEEDDDREYWSGEN